MSTESKKRVRLGDLLLEKKLISEQQLKEALEEQRVSGRKLGRVLPDVTQFPVIEDINRGVNIAPPKVGWALVEAASKEEAIGHAKRFLKIVGGGESRIRQVFGPEDGAPR